MKPEPKVFTKEHPCTKLDIWNCFANDSGTGFRVMQVDQAHALIGVNVPRVMERNGRLVRDRRQTGDLYILTIEGQVWLNKGIRSYLRNHPAEALQLRVRPSEGRPAGRVRQIRVRPAAGRISRSRPI